MGDLGDTELEPSISMAAAQQISITLAHGQYQKP